MQDFREFSPEEATPLGNTIRKPGQGVAGTARFIAGVYPACSLHGAMNRVASAQLWRCLACNIGVELELPDREHDHACCPSDDCCGGPCAAHPCWELST
jgi:hypothetical protein